MPHSKDRGFRRFFGSRLFLLLFLGLALLFAFGFARAYYQDYRVRQEIKALQSEVKNLENKKLESMEILKYVASPGFVEEKARTELNMKKPGENLLILTNLGGVEQTVGAVEEDEPLNNPIKWWYYFTNKNLTK